MIPEDLQVPGYDIEERIGRGGMASVYRARQHTFDRDVALKVLKPDLSEDEQFCQRFVQESLIVAKLHHSHIVQVYDVGEYQNNFYIAMEYLHGGDLNTRLKTGLSVNDTITVIKQASSALHFAHKKGIIHRDIKPDNIMFREDGAAVLTDFGIAKEIDSDMNLTQTGLIVGTPKYMAPEQIRGASPSASGDIYSLGILLFQCLTNHVPFHGKDMVATAFKHFNDPVPTLPPLVSAFQPIVENMLAKTPEQRYQTAMEIVDALEALSEATRSNATNLDITKAFVPPPSTLDETVVHPYNQPTQHGQSPALSERDDTPTSSSSVIEKKSTVATKPLPIWILGIAGALIFSLTAAFMIFDQGADKAESEPLFIKNRAVDSNAIQEKTRAAPPLNMNEKDSAEQFSETTKKQDITIIRLLSEAQRDIREKRLKKPDANNAFNKLKRILTLSPQHPAALAGLEQIAEEYTKLADAALSSREFTLSQQYLDHARSASPELNIVSIIQDKLTSATSNASAQKASLVSMGESLKIDGLLKGAAIDEEEGRFLSPKGDNALEKYKRILEIDRTHALAKAKVESLSQ